MSDTELRKAAREMLDALDGKVYPTHTVIDSSVIRERKQSLRAALAEPEPSIPGTDEAWDERKLGADERYVAATEPIREPTREMVAAWFSAAHDFAYDGEHRKTWQDAFNWRFAALAYAAGLKAGSGT
jgi:hypothetical protein